MSLRSPWRRSSIAAFLRVGPFAPSLARFDRNVDLSLADLRVPLVLRGDELFAFLPHKLVAVEHVGHGGGADGQRSEVVRLFLEQPLEFGDLLILLGDDLIRDVDRAFDRLPLLDRLFVVAVVGFERSQQRLLLRFPSQAAPGTAAAPVALRALASLVSSSALARLTARRNSSTAISKRRCRSSFFWLSAVFAKRPSAS